MLKTWNLNFVAQTKAGAKAKVNAEAVPDGVKSALCALVDCLPEPAPKDQPNVMVTSSGNHETGGRMQGANGNTFALVPNGFYNLWVGYSNQSPSVP